MPWNSNFFYPFSLQVLLQPVPVPRGGAGQREEPPAAGAPRPQHQALPPRPAQEQLRRRPLPRHAKGTLPLVTSTK